MRLCEQCGTEQKYNFDHDVLYSEHCDAWKKCSSLTASTVLIDQTLLVYVITVVVFFLILMTKINMY